MPQEEMRATSQRSYDANQRYEKATKKLEAVLKALKPLEAHPFETLGLASKAEFEEFVEAAEKLPDALRETRKTDREWQKAQQAASDAYKRHNGL